MDGLTKETYEKVRVKGKFEVVRGNIERFLDLKHELGSPIEADIQIVRLSETDSEVEEFVKQWKSSYADLINIKELDTWGGQIDEVSSLAVEEDLDDPNLNRKPCPNLWYHAHIHWDGVLVSCSRDYDAVTPLGNVKNGGVLKTWHGARMKMMRRWHTRGELLRDAVRRLHRVVVVESGTVRRRRHRRQDREGAHRGVDARGARARAEAAARAEQHVASRHDPGRRMTTPDLARFAPEAELLTSQGADLKRFKRFHRLGEPCLLFVGPYTRDGGLDVAIEAAHRLKETFADVRLTAIPSGPIDQKYLDACEMRALGLGHRGVIEWTVADEELPFWYATATAVCAPWRAPVGELERSAARGRRRSSVHRRRHRPSRAPGRHW